MEKYLASLSPSTLDAKSNLFSGTSKETIIIPPLNTDIRFSHHLKLHSAEDDIPYVPILSAKNKQPTHQVNSITPTSVKEFNFSKALNLHKPDYGYNPKDYNHLADNHPKTFHIHHNLPDNFSWALDSDRDSKLVKIKKSLIAKPKTQYACGSCFAICMSQVFSDCLVVSGAVGWAPNISETWLLANLPQHVQNGCGGGNPANIAPLLEAHGALDSSCIDYSWCENDKKLCAGMSSTQHFDAKSLTAKLNSQIPRKGCWFQQKRFLYKLDKGSDVFFINPEAPLELFRKNVKTHIQDFGPCVGGYVVLSNFMSGEHTNPRSETKGIYFEKCNYDGWTGLSWGSTASTAGLHAVAIVGWGVEENVLYAPGKRGSVPYWHCRNSWGTEWGYQGGYFKMAMYPFNKHSQFDKEVMTSIGGPVGSVVLLRATEPPTIVDARQVEEKYRKLKRSLPDTYYQASPQQVVTYNRQHISSGAGGAETGIDVPYSNVAFSSTTKKLVLGAAILGIGTLLIMSD